MGYHSRLGLMLTFYTEEVSLKLDAEFHVHIRATRITIVLDELFIVADCIGSHPRVVHRWVTLFVDVDLTGRLGPIPVDYGGLVVDPVKVFVRVATAFRRAETEID